MTDSTEEFKRVTGTAIGIAMLLAIEAAVGIVRAVLERCPVTMAALHGAAEQEVTHE